MWVGPWGGDNAVLVMVASDVIKFVKSPNSLKSSEGSMASCEGSVPTGNVEEMKGLGLWLGDSVKWGGETPPKLSATVGETPPFTLIMGEPPFVTL